MKSMEWYRAVKLPSAAILCFFLLLFIERKRQGLILGRSRLDQWENQAKAERVRRNRCDYCIPSDTNRTSWYEWYALVSWNTNLPPFLPPLSPTTPITPYNPPNSPLKQINCLRPPRQNGATTATTENKNQMLWKGSFPLQPSISKSYTVSQQSRP